MTEGAIWGSLIGTLTVDRLAEDVFKYLTWSAVVFVMGIPLCIIIASYITEGVMKMSGDVAKMGARKMAVANAKVKGVWNSESGDYQKVAGELTALGYVRGGTQRQTEYWVSDQKHKGGRPDVVEVTTFSEQIRSMRAQGARNKVGPVKK
jgi:hypothetical protein